LYESCPINGAFDSPDVIRFPNEMKVFEAAVELPILTNELIDASPLANTVPEG
jgi:hypothetical protein